MSASAWTPVDESANTSAWTPVDETPAQPAIADQAHAEIKAHPGGVRQWLTDLEGDLRYGGTQTAVGRALKSAGYKGAESLGGMEGTAGKTLVSPLTGPVFAAHGVAEMASGNVKRGAGEVLSGIGEAAQIPTAFAAPETAEAASGGLSKLADKASSLTPSGMREAAGELFKQAMSKAKDIPVDVEAPGQVALKMKTLYQRGAGYTPPAVVNRFLNRVTQPEAAPMTYEEARDFYSNASRLSADEALKLTPRAKALLGQFVSELGDSISQAAQQGGVGYEHSKAMFDYAHAMRYADRIENLKQAGIKVGTKAALGAVGGAGAAAAYEGYKALNQ